MEQFTRDCKTLGDLMYDSADAYYSMMRASALERLALEERIAKNVELIMPLWGKVHIDANDLHIVLPKLLGHGKHEIAEWRYRMNALCALLSNKDE